LIAEGLDNQTIARRLVLNPKTVRNHVSNVLAKVHASDRSHAIVLARQAGYDHALVEAVPFAALGAPADRPRYALLENRALAALVGGADRMPLWRDALSSYLMEELGR